MTKHGILKLMIMLAILGTSIGISSDGEAINPIDIQKILDKTVDHKKVFGVVLNLSLGSGESWSGASGNLTSDDPYFIASVTKLYTTAIIFMLANENQIDLDDPISQYLSPNVVEGLHVFKNRDYSGNITIRHLLSHTSGLPDYFEQEYKTKTSLKDELVSGDDRSWTFEDAIQISKEMQPHFAPGQQGKAFYSDTNFQLLGRIIENVSGVAYEQALEQYIVEPLALNHTYLYPHGSDKDPSLFYYKDKALSLPLAMASFGPDGGIVSTSEESMIFLRAFFSGFLFPKDYLNEMQSWNKIFFPMQYGLGMMRFKLPRIFSPFKATPEFIGHVGSSGSFAYYCPDKDVYFTGTVNQINNPGLSSQLLMKIHASLK